MPLTSTQNIKGASTSSTSDKAKDVNLEKVSRDLESLNNDIDLTLHDDSGLKSFSVCFQSRIEIMNVLKKLYCERVNPTYPMLFDILTKVIKSNDGFLTSNYGVFHKKMKVLGFIEKETADGNKIIIENPEQRFARFLYLTKIRKIRARNHNQIIYIDERIINQKLNYEKLFTAEDLTAESCLFFHAISKEGFINGLFCNQATENNFNKWVTDILLGILKDPCIIILDNGPLHGKLEDQCPITRYSTKSEMLKWLNNNNIPCSYNLSTPELYELIDKNKRNIKEYKIDKIMRSHGHEVLRLPDGMLGLNLTDVLWKAIGDSKTAKTLSKSDALPMLQTKIMDTILPTISTGKWPDMERILSLKEHDMYNIDATIECRLESIVIK